MTLILIPAALAALWCFRAARTVALFGIAALILWACLSSSHAQMTSIVQCRAGNHSFVVGEELCPIILKAWKDMDQGYRTRTNMDLYKNCTKPMFDETGGHFYNEVNAICSSINTDAFMAEMRRR